MNYSPIIVHGNTEIAGEGGTSQDSIIASGPNYIILQDSAVSQIRFHYSLSV
jgi:hypothetical protein